MAEPIAEVFVIRCEGLKDKVYLDGELADRMLDDQRSAGWDVTLERLPIATPEMQRVVEASKQFPFATPDLAADAERYRWLKDRYHGVDFDYPYPSLEAETAMVFRMKENMLFSGDLDSTIDAARAGEVK